MSNHEVDSACRSASLAFPFPSGLPSQFRAAVLDSIATALDARRDHILKTCSDETALTIEELTPEFARMTGTLRMFGDLVREGSWVRAAIDTPIGNPIGPNHDLRSLLSPLGPVAVFGSSNFPLAYGVCGGDTASALAAGCPVIIKEHPAHPRTGRLLANIAQHAIASASDEPDAQARVPFPPAALLQYIHNENVRDFSVARELVQNDLIAAVGFTGSIQGGLAIERIARERRVPIPVFAEMGSNNVVMVEQGAAAADPDRIAQEIAGSILQRFGQQCTCPGLIIVDGDSGRDLVDRLARYIGGAPGRDMLSPWIKESYEERLRKVECVPGVRVIARGGGKSGARGSSACLFELPADISTLAAAFRTDALREEIFGPAAVVLHASIDMLLVLGLRGALTFSIYADAGEVERDRVFEAFSRTGMEFAGRIIFNGPPTGVRVATSTVHGGPFPATNAPHTTAVGPRAIERFCRPICFQNCPDNLLPPELQNANPRNLWRTTNGTLTQAPLP